MLITVHIYAHLRYYLPEPPESIAERQWEVPKGSTVAFVLKKMRLPKEIRVSVLVNNDSANQGTVLNEGDVIHILPQMAGGSQLTIDD